MKYFSKKQILAGLLVLGVIILLRFTGISDVLSLENLKHNREHLQYFVANHYLLSVLLYILLYIAVVATTVPLALVMTIAGGFLFGVFPGVFYANIGATTGAVISFLWMRHFLGRAIQRKYKDRLHNFNKNMDQYGSFYFLALHLIGIIPFFILNMLAAMTNITLFTFIWTTSIGIFPVAVLLSYMGQKLGTFASVEDVLTPQVMMVFVTIALLAFMPVLWPKIKKLISR